MARQEQFRSGEVVQEMMSNRRRSCALTSSPQLVRLSLLYPRQRSRRKLILGQAVSEYTVTIMDMEPIVDNCGRRALTRENWASKARAIAADIAKFARGANS